MKKNTLLAFALLMIMIVFPVLNQGFMFTKPVFGQVSDIPPIVPPFQTLDLTNQVVTLNYSVIFQFRGTLILNNSTLSITKSLSNITFQDSTLNSVNSKIIGADPFYIYFEGDSSATISDTTVDCGRGGIFLKGTTEAVINDLTIAGSLHTYDSAHLTATNSQLNPSAGKINPAQGLRFMETFDQSSVSISSSTVREISTFNNSIVSISSSVLILPINTAMRTFNSSKMIVTDSGEEWRLEAHDYSSALVGNSKMQRLEAYDSSLVTVSQVTFKDGMLVYGSSNVFIFDSTFAETVTLTAYLSMFGSSTVSVAGTIIHGMISTHDSSVVSISDSAVDWFTAGDSSEGSISKSQISSFYAQAHSRVSVKDTSATTLHTSDTSNVSISDSVITTLTATSSSIISLKTSKVNETLVYFKSINGSFVGIATGLLKQWGGPADVEVSIGSGGYAPEISVSNTEIQFWSMFFTSSPNITITNSTLNSLSIKDSTAKLVGTTVTSYDISSGARAFLYWYLDVQTESGASVTVSYSNTTLVDSKLADEQGLASFTLFQKTIDSSEGNPATTSYTIDVSSPSFSGQQTVEMDGNKQVALTPPPPFWIQYWYIFVVVAVAAVALVLVWRMRTARSAEKAVATS